jgi:hypothetical protein
MQNEIYFQIYSSMARKPFSAEELRALLAGSRENNARLNLSGMLLYKNGDFMQVLEGPEPAVRTLLEIIRADPRHDNVVKLLEGTTPERQFPGWYMGFCDLDTEDVQSLPGYTDFINLPLSAGLSADPTACHRLLQMFKAQRADPESRFKTGDTLFVSMR